MSQSGSGLSDVAMALMVGYARGDARVVNAISLHFVHGQSFRRIGRAVGVQHTTVRDWVNGYASAGKDYCRINGVGPEALISAAGQADAA